VREAERELSETSKEDFDELAAIEQPPPCIVGVLQALCALLQVVPSLGCCRLPAACCLPACSLPPCCLPASLPPCILYMRVSWIYIYIYIYIYIGPGAQGQ